MEIDGLSKSGRDPMKDKSKRRQALSDGPLSILARIIAGVYRRDLALVSLFTYPIVIPGCNAAFAYIGISPQSQFRWVMLGTEGNPYLVTATVCS